jgi:uncharacterized damage-inducible protein DinB
MSEAWQEDTGLTGERADLAEMLDRHRQLLLMTVRGLDDEQAALRTTVSELCLGGIVKHVTAVEQNWCRFIREGPSQQESQGDGWDPAAVEEYKNGFRMLPGETLAGLVEAYEQTGRQTRELVATFPDLDSSQPLPPAPWFKPGARWTARHTLLHIMAETAQHAGHADIIRETLDGAKSMG